MEARDVGVNPSSATQLKQETFFFIISSHKVRPKEKPLLLDSANANLRGHEAASQVLTTSRNKADLLEQEAHSPKAWRAERKPGRCTASICTESSNLFRARPLHLFRETHKSISQIQPALTT